MAKISWVKAENYMYPITENLGYQHSRGCYAKMVATGQGERVVVKCNGSWKFAKPLIIAKTPICGQAKISSESETK